MGEPVQIQKPLTAEIAEQLARDRREEQFRSNFLGDLWVASLCDLSG
jgi:hypothetical protein